MQSYELNQIDKPHHGQKWQFQIDGEAAQLVSPAGQPVAFYTPDQAQREVEIVRFARSGHNVAITLDGSTLHFTAWPKAFKALKAFTELSAHAANPEEMRSLRNSGLIYLMIGGLMTVGGGILSIDGILKLIEGRQSGGQFYVFYGAILFGLIFLYKSWYYYAEARRLERRHQ